MGTEKEQFMKEKTNRKHKIFKPSIQRNIN